MLVYVRYIKQPTAARYLLVLLIFAFGLMAKSMLVTLPFVFLLLDYWPLNRINGFNWKIIYRLILEKIPFIFLSAVSSVITFLVQRKSGAMPGININGLPLKARTVNAFLSYARYIGEMFWPQNMAVFYPFDAGSFAFRQVAMCVLLLLVMSIFVIRFGRNQKYLPVGWFWFVGTLVPVIGFVQVGSQAYADRYTYVPYIGLFIMLAWGLPELLAKLLSASPVESPQRKIALGLSMVIVLTTLGICAHRQTSYWKNSFTLFSHALAVTQNNYVAYGNLGVAYVNLNSYNKAIDAYQQAIKINPEYAFAYHALGVACAKLSRYQDAIESYKQAIRIKPDEADAHYNLGNSYAKLGRWPEAIDAYKQAIRIQPDLADVYRNLGNAYARLGRYQDAIEFYKQAIRRKPDDAEAEFDLGNACYALGRRPEAIETFRQAIGIKPDYAEAYYNLGIAYDDLGRYAEAIDAYKQAVRIKPDDDEAHCRLGAAYLAIGDKNSALAEYNILKSLNSELANKLLKEINK
jgi:tetratricopeptide (TPR) repeat protein